MEKYEVEITEYLQRIIEVEAESPDDAVYRVEEDYDNCNIVLDSGDFTGKDIGIYNPNKFISKFDLLMDRIKESNRECNKSIIDLVQSISKESNKLLECYQENDTANLYDVEEKLAVVMKYCLLMSMLLKLDPVKIINDKIDKGEE